MHKQAIIRSYIKRAGKNCPYSFKRKLMEDLKSNLYDYIDENPNASYSDIVEHFGLPEKFSDEYILAMDDDTRKKLISKNKWLKLALSIGVTIFVIIATVTSIWIIVENSQTAGVYYSEGISE